MVAACVTARRASDLDPGSEQRIDDDPPLTRSPEPVIPGGVMPRCGNIQDRFVVAAGCRNRAEIKSGYENSLPLHSAFSQTHR